MGSRRYRGYRRRRRAPAVLLIVVVLVLLAVGLFIFLRPGAPPTNTTMSLTVPEMGRVSDDPVYSGPATDTRVLDTGALHVQDTGFPWQQGSNVYIAGHRLGYPGTQSYLQFYDLDRLKEGDEIILTDADGTRYTYEVFRSLTVDPYDYYVTEPLAGRSIVSLQTCTLPDYSRRLIVQGDLVSVE